ncbi:hypothetical protein VPH35_065736 [Triticum aestivum]|uniref:uncharacterized protein n=1 Tax=Triticum aestivum TaxID=4565 RepID=UPI001D00694A|nr:uncharacterized protein LOC123081943 [Triticum aestivum]
MEGAGGPVVADLRRDIAAACEQRITQDRAHTMATYAFSDAVLSARSLAEHSVAHRGTRLPRRHSSSVQVYIKNQKTRAYSKRFQVHFKRRRWGRPTIGPG